jgi:class 3 adenylate cyclase
LIDVSGVCGLEPAGSKFCIKCGVTRNSDFERTGCKTSPSRKSVQVTLPRNPKAFLDRERETVTALFTDINGSTELMQDLDSKEARLVIYPPLKLMIDTVHRYDGYRKHPRRHRG